MKGFFHVALFDEQSIAIYREIADALNKSRLAESSDSVEVHLIGKKELYEVIAKDPLIENANLTYGGEDLGQFEYPTLLALELYCRQNPTDIVYYIHSKGASKPYAPHSKYWRLAMIHFVIERWQNNYNPIKTDTVDTIGYNWRGNHYSGNWWFSTAKYICSLPSLVELQKNPETIWHSQTQADKLRHQCEFWIGKSKPRTMSVGATNFDYMQIHPMFKTFDTNGDTFEKAGITVSKKYLINLIRRRDRKEHVLAQLEKAGIKNVLTYPAFDGASCGWQNVRFQANRGMAGCYITHQAILTEAYLNNYEAVVIMEDDAVFCNGFSEIFPYIWKGVPKDWEIVWIGNTERNGVANRVVADQVTIPQDIWGTQCYIVNRKGIEKICNYIWNVPMPDHIDITITRHVPNLIEYALTPSLVDQAKLKSDIAQ